MGQPKSMMSAEERWKALLNRQPVDRVSFFPIGTNFFCCQNVGYAVLDQYTDMEKCFEAMRKIPEQYGYFPFIYRARS